jgi:hypothetical protein
MALTGEPHRQSRGSCASQKITSSDQSGQLGGMAKRALHAGLFLSDMSRSLNSYPKATDSALPNGFSWFCPIHFGGTGQKEGTRFGRNAQPTRQWCRFFGSDKITVSLRASD